VVAPIQATIPPTTAPEPGANPSCAGPWQQAYRDGSPDAEAQIRRALATEAISATVRSSTYGETDGCGVFHAAALDIEVTVQVENLADRGALGAQATRISAIVRQIYERTRFAPNLGRRQVIFVSSGATCRWDPDRGACQP
jgi:hypothetical protein